MMDSQSPGASKNTITTSPNSLPPPVQGLKCPRCDSSNTKFCYYNNYSLTQPRHFCKTCRRYWTKGGALRNVPVGGGCRKSKKSKSSASSCSSSSSSSRLPFDHFDAIADPTGGGVNFFPGLSPALAGDFQLGVFPFSRLHSSTSNQFISGATSMVGFNYPSPSAVGLYSEMGGGGSSFAVNNSTHNSLSSSIESLSSINQDLHWKLQQQRLGMFTGGGTHKESTLPAPLVDDQQEPISFQMTDSSRAEVSDTNTKTAWFLENSYTMPNANGNKMPNNNSTTTNNSDNNNNNTSNWNGIPTWNDMHQFTTLP